MTRFRRGASVLAAAFPEVPFVPVYLHGFGKSLPRGEWWFVPFASEVHIGHPRRAGDSDEPMAELLQSDVEAMADKARLIGFAPD
jgi:1-acyl-sn-glycerol-3-phosphate acyltransferase